MIAAAITGMGVVTPLGNDLHTYAEALLAGRSGVGPLLRFDPASLPTQIAAEVDGVEALPGLPDPKIAYALAASEQAMGDANRHGSPLHQHYQGGRVALGLGLELFSVPDLLRQQAGLAPPVGRHALGFLQTPSDLCVALLARAHGLRLPPVTCVSACAASTDAIGQAARALEPGHFALAGGTDAMVNPMGLGGFCQLGATSRRNHQPQAASRPFDRDRDGFVLGEGAAMLVLEPLAGAQARGARIYGVLRGYGCSFDAHAISEPHPQGAGALLAMRRALAEAELAPEALSMVNAHGTSTPKNDVAEARALGRLLGARCAQVPVHATKSMIGHLIAAAGAAELVAALVCARRGRMHGTRNLEQLDPACPLWVPREAQPLAGRWLLKSSFAFGGQNACLVLEVAE